MKNSDLVTWQDSNFHQFMPVSLKIKVLLEKFKVNLIPGVNLQMKINCSCVCISEGMKFRFEP